MGFLGKLAAAVIQTAIIPVELVKDIATLGGSVNDGYLQNGDHTYTGKRLKQIGETLEDAIADLKND